jgi:glycerol-3-phosphate acyltransferase PlsX
MSQADNIILAVDAHGGDFGPSVTVPAALAILKSHADIEIVLCGLPAEMQPFLPTEMPTRLSINEASHALATDARPVEALRRGKGSSMWLAMELAANGTAHACVSAGSTAAMLALGVKLVGLLPGIERPALMSRIPSATGNTGMLDLGANLNVSATQLVQFAIMGAMASPAKGDGKPTVALLNVGHEDSKGNDVVREAHAILNELPINYIGFIEGHDIFAGKADVAVCDGFTGNLIIKSGEGIARMFFHHLQIAFNSSIVAKLGGALAKPALKRVMERFQPSQHNGAPLLGLRHVVVKSHGHADIPALQLALLEAISEARQQVPQLIETMIQDYSIEAEA